MRRIEGPAKAGIHRVSWDLRLPPTDPIDLTPVGFRPPWASDPEGPLAAPGTYTAEMALLTHEGLSPRAEAQTFEVKPVPGTALPTADYARVAAFQEETADLLRKLQGSAEELGSAQNRLKHMRHALLETPRADPELFAELAEIEAIHAQLRTRLRGDGTRRNWNEPSVPSILGRAGRVAGGHWGSRQSPTETQRRNLEIAARQYEELVAELRALLEDTLPAYEMKLESAGAPWTPARRIPVR